MKTIAIKADNISKMYKLYDRPIDRLKEALKLTRKVRFRPHYALNSVSFQVEKGETVGIIGVNGAGKSTILKIITGVLNQTSGNLEINGRISALLELGAGFNGEYTGIENVYLNGTMIGFSREEIDRKMDSILEFADIGNFVHQPVKTYSSGMFVRLAFAVAINIEPEILIVDEALSVGDVFFQAKCYKKFEEFKKEGRTILFVSHDLGSVSKYCDRVVLLNKGEKLGEGTPREMINLYKKVLVNQLDETDIKCSDTEGEIDDRTDKRADSEGISEKQSLSKEQITKEDEATREGQILRKEQEEEVEETAKNPLNNDIVARKKEIFIKNREIYNRESSVKNNLSINPNYIDYGTKDAEIVDFVIYDNEGNVSGTLLKEEGFVVKIKLRVNKPVLNPIVAFTITNLKGEEISGTNTIFEGKELDFTTVGAEIIVTFTQTMDFQGGEYLLSLGCTGYEGDNFTVYHRLYDVCGITVISNKNTVGFFDMNSEVEVEVV